MPPVALAVMVLIGAAMSATACHYCSDEVAVCHAHQSRLTLRFRFEFERYLGAMHTALPFDTLPGYEGSYRFQQVENLACHRYTVRISAGGAFCAHGSDSMCG